VRDERTAAAGDREESSAGGLTASLTHVLDEHHPDQQGERVAAERLVGPRVLGDAEGRHTRILPHGRAPPAIRLRDAATATRRCMHSFPET
jgi:hypothetical protein